MLDEESYKEQHDYAFLEDAFSHFAPVFSQVIFYDFELGEITIKIKFEALWSMVTLCMSTTNCQNLIGSFNDTLNQVF